MGEELSELIDRRILPYKPKHRPKLHEPEGRPACYGYVRVSLEKQVAGSSLDAQADAIREQYQRRYAATHEPLQIIAEQESGARLKFSERERGGWLYRTLKPRDVLIVAKVDRFSRSLSSGLAELFELRKRGVNILCLDMGGMMLEFDGGPAEIILTLMLWAAQFERKRILERCADGQRRARAARKGTPREWKHNICPYGFRRTGPARYVPDPEWRHYVRSLMALYEFGVRELGYSKCDGRHRMLAERYGLTWWRNYSRKGKTGERTAAKANVYLRWFRNELALQKKERAAGIVPAVIAEPWREERDAGTFIEIGPLPNWLTGAL